MSPWSWRKSEKRLWTTLKGFEKQVAGTLVWFMMSHWLVLIWIRIQDNSLVLPFLFILVCVENYVCLPLGVQVTCAVWRAAMSIVAGVGDLVLRNRDGQAQVRYSVTGWSRDRMVLCTVCTMHMKMRSTGFLIEPQNQGRRFVSGLISKPLWRFLLVWPQNLWRRFLGLASKPVATVWWFGPQNHRNSFLVWTSKPSGFWFISCAIKLMGGRRRKTCIEIWRLALCSSKLYYDFSVWHQYRWRRDCGWCKWHHYGGYIEMNLKTDGLYWTPLHLVCRFLCIRLQGIIVF
jgi:hypothetical protein